MIKGILNIILCFGFVVSVQAKIDEVVFMRNGVYVGKIDSYSYNNNLYLNASKASKLFGNKIYWYPVSGKLLLQVKGNRIIVSMKSDKVSFGKTKVTISNPMIIRGGNAYLLIDFWTSKDFSRIFGFRLSYNPTTKILEAQKKVNIGSVKYFSYKDRTRIVFHLEDALNYQTSQKKGNVLITTILDGVLNSNEKIINITDGIVKTVELKQENKYAKIIIDLGENFESWNSFTLKSPHRIVFDIMSKKQSLVPAETVISEPDIKVISPKIQVSTFGVSNASHSFHALGQSADDDSDQSLPADRQGDLTTQMVEEPAQKLADNQEKSIAALSVKIPDKIVFDKTSTKRIVIDAGHGGKDIGGRRIFGMKEKDINLHVAKELYQLLKKEKIFDVLMTRTSDVFIPLSERCRITNNFKPDIFISLHANAARDKRKNGFEIYSLSENASDPWAAEVAEYENSVLEMEDESSAQIDPTAILLHSLARNEYINEGSYLAANIAKEYEKNTPFKNRGVRHAAFYVLRGSYAPGVLVEMGFMTNSSDQANLNNRKVRTKIAEAIYKGIMEYAKTKKWK